MKIDRQMKGEYAILVIEGELNLYNMSDLKEIFNDVIQKKDCNLVLEMKNVSYIDSNAIGLLFNTRTRLLAANRELYINNLSPELSEILRFMGLSFPAISLQEK